MKSKNLRLCYFSVFSFYYFVLLIFCLVEIQKYAKELFFMLFLYTARPMVVADCASFQDVRIAQKDVHASLDYTNIHTHVPLCVQQEHCPSLSMCREIGPE